MSNEFECKYPNFTLLNAAPEYKDSGERQERQTLVSRTQTLVNRTSGLRGVQCSARNLLRREWKKLSLTTDRRFMAVWTRIGTEGRRTWRREFTLTSLSSSSFSSSAVILFVALALFYSSFSSSYLFFLLYISRLRRSCLHFLSFCSFLFP